MGHPGSKDSSAGLATRLGFATQLKILVTCGPNSRGNLPANRPTRTSSTIFVWRRFWRPYPLLWIVMIVGLYHYLLRG